VAIYRLPAFETKILASTHSVKHLLKMQFTSVILIFATTFIGLALARPAGGPADAWEDCPGGSFYVCNSKSFAGCCSVDPCSLATCPTPTPTPPPRGPSPIVPIPRLPVNQTCQQGQNKLYQPKMHSYFPHTPEISDHITSDIHLTQLRNGSLGQQQVVVFSNIPSTAKNCGLNWAVGNDSDQFNSSNPGLVDVTILHDPLPANITWNTMSKLWGHEIGQAEFDEWTNVTRPHEHIVGALDCSETLVFKMGINGTDDGEVDLTQNEGSGWYIEYEC
jgi:hypothetical protein